jgi:hypothetical protein
MRNTVCVLMTRHNEVVRELLLHTERVDGLPHFAVGVGVCSATTTRSPNTPAASRRVTAMSNATSAVRCDGVVREPTLLRMVLPGGGDALVLVQPSTVFEYTNTVYTREAKGPKRLTAAAAKKLKIPPVGLYHLPAVDPAVCGAKGCSGTTYHHGKPLPAKEGGGVDTNVVTIGCCDLPGDQQCTNAYGAGVWLCKSCCVEFAAAAVRAGIAVTACAHHGVVPADVQRRVSAERHGPRAVPAAAVSLETASTQPAPAAAAAGAAFAAAGSADRRLPVAAARIEAGLFGGSSALSAAETARITAIFRNWSTGEQQQPPPVQGADAADADDLDAWGHLPRPHAVAGGAGAAGQTPPTVGVDPQKLVIEGLTRLISGLAAAPAAGAGADGVRAGRPAEAKVSSAAKQLFGSQDVDMDFGDQQFRSAVKRLYDAAGADSVFPSHPLSAYSAAARMAKAIAEVGGPLRFINSVWLQRTDKWAYELETLCLAIHDLLSADLEDKYVSRALLTLLSRAFVVFNHDTGSVRAAGHALATLRPGASAADRDFIAQLNRTENSITKALEGGRRDATRGGGAGATDRGAPRARGRGGRGRGDARGGGRGGDRGSGRGSGRGGPPNAPAGGVDS